MKRAAAPEIATALAKNDALSRHRDKVARLAHAPYVVFRQTRHEAAILSYVVILIHRRRSACEAHRIRTRRLFDRRLMARPRLARLLVQVLANPGDIVHYRRDQRIERIEFHHRAKKMHRFDLDDVTVNLS